MLAVLTNEHPTDLYLIVLEYFQNIVIGSTTAPDFYNSDAFTYNIGDAGVYFVHGLMDDP